MGACFAFWLVRGLVYAGLVGVAAADQILPEHRRPEVSVPIAQAVGLHTETRGVLREVVQ